MEAGSPPPACSRHEPPACLWCSSCHRGCVSVYLSLLGGFVCVCVSVCALSGEWLVSPAWKLLLLLIITKAVNLAWILRLQTAFRLDFLLACLLIEIKVNFPLVRLWALWTASSFLYVGIYFSPSFNRDLTSPKKSSGAEKGRGKIKNTLCRNVNGSSYPFKTKKREIKRN